ncbi:inner membrane protein [Citrobacter braakii]|nr:inner membrane protein [Citrobacter braakii]
MDHFASLFMVSPLLLGVLFFVAMLAGFIDSLAGGGGLLTIPALMAAGMPPAQALATNKLQACGGSISSSLYFIRRGVVNLADQKLNIFMTFIGSMSGALLVQHVQSDILRQILPVLVICIGLYFLLMPKVGEEDRQRRLHGLPFALVAGGCVGFYDGFFWSGCGVVLRAGLCHAVRLQPGEIDGPRQSIKCHIEYRRAVAVCPRRQSDLGDRICDAHWPVYWRTDGLTAGAQ